MNGMTENDPNMISERESSEAAAMEEMTAGEIAALLKNDDSVLSRQEAVAEALVFASGEPVKLESIAIVLGVDKREASKVMDRLCRRYEDRKGGVILRKMDRSYQFCTVPELREELRPFFDRSNDRGLSRAAMETLSIICYNQPVTRAGIEYVRGVNSDGVLVRLIEKGLVEECGRSDAPGRPILYGTTLRFLQAMGVEKLSDLPYVQKIVFNEHASGTESGPAGDGANAAENKTDPETSATD